jgi:protein TonB
MKTLLKIISIASIIALSILPAQQSVVDDQGVYLMCEKMPELVGGMDAIQKKIRYPLQAKSLGVQGVVYVQSIIDEKGKIVEPKVVKKLGAGCDEEALRVLKKSKFKPGYDKGKPVKVRFTLPIFFRL